jgi:peptidoglycan/LPS O-acetylase OafA/YrhL
LFFVISSFLFFRLLAIEDARTGGINIANFYIRRLLRLYPLMVAFPVVMLLTFGPLTIMGISRLLGLATFTDNFQIWLWGYSPISYSGHLWTLSYEFQLYLIIPLAFLLYRALGATRFIYMLGAFWTIACGARLAVIMGGSQHPVIWVTPFLRPESTLVGIMLALGVFARVPAAAIATSGLLSLIFFTQIPNTGNAWTMLIYPLCAVSCGAVVWLALNCEVVSKIFGASWMAFLGRISYGLYVFHLLAIGLAVQLVTSTASPAGNETLTYALDFGVALALTIALSVASYFGFERFFLKEKTRFSAVESRPV